MTPIIRTLTLLLLLSALGFINTALADPPRLVVCYDSYPPSAMIPTPTDPKRGFVIDMLAEIFTAQGYQLEFVTTPYARSLKAVEEGDCHLTPLVNPSIANVVLFPIQPSFSYKQAFFVKRDNPWRYHDANSLKQLSAVATVVGYEYKMEPAYDQYLQDPANKTKINVVTGEHAIEQIFRMILAGRIDTFNETFLTGSYLAKEKGFSEQLAIGGIFNQPLVLKPAFSPKLQNVQKLMAIWDAGRLKIQRTGKEKEYLARYGIMEIP
ncbi:MAG: transporter substrate-binding domain-containing protein [Methylococcales bacterium]|nr:transporter substrate-binding domain-containing protein [Methylococcales bacterium]